MRGYRAARGRFQYLVEYAPALDDFDGPFGKSVVHLGVGDEATRFVGRSAVLFDPIGVLFDTANVPSHGLARNP